MSTSGLQSFLTPFETKDSKNATHTQMGRINGKYNIPTEKTDELFTLIQEHSKKFKHIGLVERPGKSKKFMIDLDLHYSEQKRHFTIEQIEKFLDSLQEKIYSVKN